MIANFSTNVFNLSWVACDTKAATSELGSSRLYLAAVIKTKTSKNTK